MPFDQTNTKTLADAIAILEMERSLTVNKRRDLISSIKRIATYLHRAPNDLPANANALRKLLAKIHPVQAGITAKSLANVKANLVTVLQITGAIPRDEPRAERTEGWIKFLDHAGAKHQAWSLSRFTTYCCNRRIEPDAVSNDVMAAFQSQLDVRLLTKDPAKLCKEMAQTWNGIVKRNNQPLAILSYEIDGRYRCRPLSDYPESLQMEIATYLDRLAHVDLFDKDGPLKPLRPTSLRNTQAHLRQYLDGLVLAGEDTAKLTTLKIVVTPEKMKLALRRSWRGVAAIRSLSEYTTSQRH